MKSTVPPITLVICTRDRPEQLSICLKAALAQDHPRFEIIVVDNAPSDDRTARLVAKLPVRYLVEERPGLSVARNLGAAMAGYPLIAFTDDDVRPERGWLRTMAMAFQEPEVMAVTGLVLPAVLETPAQIIFEQACGGMGKGTEARTFRRRELSARELIAAQHMGVGVNMAFRREAFERVGLFDPWLGAGTPGRAAEDLDMFHRVVAGGLSLRYEPGAIVRHHHVRTMAHLSRQLYDSGYGHAQYLAKMSSTGRISGASVAATGLLWYARLAARLVGAAVGLFGAPVRLARAQFAGAMVGRRVKYGAGDLAVGLEAAESIGADREVFLEHRA